jgi:hydrogenase expression/formation protein HypE
MLGLDPLYVANEGVFVAMLPADLAEAAVAALRSQSDGREACIIGRVTDRHAGIVALETALGGSRVVDMLPGDQLPRIC